VAYMLVLGTGDPAGAIAGPDASPDDVARVRRELGYDQPLPILRLQLHDWVLAHDRRDGRWWIGGRALDGDAAALDHRLSAARDLAVHNLATRGGSAAGADQGGNLQALEFVSGLERPAYLAAVEAVRSAIERGEIYQANVTRRLAASFAGDPWQVYRRLRTGDPALFAAYLPLDRGPGPVRAIVSASPEPFLSVTAGGRVATDPIKAQGHVAGTGRRTGAWPASSSARPRTGPRTS